MRLLFALVALACLACSSSASASDVKLTRVWSEFRTADSFMRISEYFTGKENPGRKQSVFRTQPGDRDGYYFLARIKNDGPAIAEAKIVLHLITPRAPTPEIHTFSAAIPHGQHVYHIGLTGKDWPGPDTNPVAWKLEFLAPDGQPLTAQQSFLWSKPDRG